MFEYSGSEYFGGQAVTEEQLARATITYYVDSASGELPADQESLEDGEIVARQSIVTLTDFINQNSPKG
jgi:hypothetical protein